MSASARSSAGAPGTLGASEASPAGALRFPTARTSATRKSPSASVPVLSIITTFTRGATSRARRRRTSRPLRAPSEVERAATSGMARPSACGHAMTNTVTMRVSASDTLPVTASHATNATRPTLTAA